MIEVISQDTHSLYTYTEIEIHLASTQKSNIVKHSLDSTWTTRDNNFKNTWIR